MCAKKWLILNRNISVCNNSKRYDESIAKIVCEHISPKAFKSEINFKLFNYKSYMYIPLPDISIIVRVSANGPGDLGSIPGWVIPKTLKMVLDASLLNTQHYKVRIKGKAEKYRERSSVLLYTLV